MVKVDSVEIIEELHNSTEVKIRCKTDSDKGYVVTLRFRWYSELSTVKRTSYSSVSFYENGHSTSIPFVYYKGIDGMYFHFLDTGKAYNNASGKKINWNKTFRLKLIFDKAVQLLFEQDSRFEIFLEFNPSHFKLMSDYELI